MGRNTMRAGGPRRLNDTAAIAASPPSENQEHSISVRKIDNGFVARSSTCNSATGEYKSSEQYFPSAPRIIPAKVARSMSDDAGGGLADTMAYLNSKGKGEGGLK
jgi:hypothetical protein